METRCEWFQNRMLKSFCVILFLWIALWDAVWFLASWNQPSVHIFLSALSTSYEKVFNVERLTCLIYLKGLSFLLTQLTAEVNQLSPPGMKKIHSFKIFPTSRKIQCIGSYKISRIYWQMDGWNWTRRNYENTRWINSMDSAANSDSIFSWSSSLFKRCTLVHEFLQNVSLKIEKKDEHSVKEFYIFVSELCLGPAFTF